MSGETVTLILCYHKIGRGKPVKFSFWVKAWYFAGTERHGELNVLLRAVSWWFCKALQFVKLQVKLTLLVNWNLYRSLNLQLRGNKICSVSFCISWKYFLFKCTCALSSTVFLPLLRIVFSSRSLQAKWYKPVSHCNIADLAKWLVWFYLPKSRPLKKKKKRKPGGLSSSNSLKK